MSTLSDILRNANTRNLSSRQLAEEASKRGHSLAHATIARYLRGDHPALPQQEILEIFSEILAIPLNQLERAAGAPETEEVPFNLPAKANALNQSERKAILQLIDVMVEAKTPAPAKPWQKNLPTPDDMAYHIGAETPDGEEFRPDLYQNHRMLWDRYREEWAKHYTLAAQHKKPGDDIDEPYTD